MHHILMALVGLLFLVQYLPGQPQLPGKLRYLRPAGEGWTNECLFTLGKKDGGWSIVSVTERDPLRLTLETLYGPENTLLTSKVTVRDKDKETAASVSVEQGVVRIQQRGRPRQEFAAPRGVIVTSAPDWTDVLLLCSLYDHTQAGQQTFPALWIHPEMPHQLLKLTIERQGYEMIQQGAKEIKLARFAIQLRGKSRYVGWATMDGTMVRLIPLPAGKQRSGLIADGFQESSAKDLVPAGP
jgi:hypothetical protein